MHYLFNSISLPNKKGNIVEYVAFFIYAGLTALLQLFITRDGIFNAIVFGVI